MKSYTAQKNDENKRLDIFLAENIKNLSRSSIQKLCDMRKITVNGVVEYPSKRLHEGDKAKINFDIDSLKKIPKISLPIIYEDDSCIVLNKPTGLLTHSKGAFNPEPTVASFIEPKIKSLRGERAGIVHRLDRGTSGLIICAKNQDALKWLQKQFSERKVKKEYTAVVEGQLSPSKALIDMPIIRNPKRPQTFKVSNDGREALTEYQTIKTGNLYSLVKLRPKTGRTHQLRVHLKQLGHPIVGDMLYGGKEAERLFLHASTLEITLPNRSRKVFEIDPPKEFLEKANG